MAIVTDEEYIQRALEILAKRQDTRKLIDKQRQLQRRNTVTDSKTDFHTMLRGADRIYTGFKITADMQFIMSYSFNLHIRPYVSQINLNPEISKTHLDISTGVVIPDPHGHNMKLEVEITEHLKDTSNLKIAIQGIDITDAIISEYGSFVEGYGYFPSQDTSFDVLKLLDYLYPWEQSVILSPGFKEIEISQDLDSLCECEISYYIKYNHVDRGGLA